MDRFSRNLRCSVVTLFRSDQPDETHVKTHTQNTQSFVQGEGSPCPSCDPSLLQPLSCPQARAQRASGPLLVLVTFEAAYVHPIHFHGAAERGSSSPSNALRMRWSMCHAVFCAMPRSRCSRCLRTNTEGAFDPYKGYAQLVRKARITRLGFSANLLSLYRRARIGRVVALACPAFTLSARRCRRDAGTQARKPHLRPAECGHENASAERKPDTWR